MMESDDQSSRKVMKIEMASITVHSSGNSFRWLYSVNLHCASTVVGLKHEEVNWVISVV